MRFSFFGVCCVLRMGGGVGFVDVGAVWGWGFGGGAWLSGDRGAGSGGGAGDLGDRRHSGFLITYSGDAVWLSSGGVQVWAATLGFRASGVRVRAMLGLMDLSG